MTNSRLTRALIGAVVRWPRLSLAVASLLDRVWPTPRGGRRRCRRRWVMMVLQMHGSTGWSYPNVARGPDPSSLRPPLVLVTIHMGAIEALGALLERLPAEVLSLVGRSMPSRPNVTRLPVWEGEWQRVAATKRAADTLRSGGFVFAALDVSAAAQLEVTVRGLKLQLATGPFALSRLTGAPMLPVSAVWRGRKIELVAGEPIAPTEAPAMAAALAAWLERYLIATPEAMERLLIHVAQRSPRSSSSARS